MSHHSTSNISSARIHQQIDIAVAKKSLNAARQQGEAAVQLIEAAAEISAQKTSGAIRTSDGRLDVKA